IKELKMRNMIRTTNIDFLKWYRPTLAASIVVIAIVLVAVFMRGSSIFDTDFSGGTSLVMNLTEPMDDAEVRRLLDEKFETLRVDGSSAQYTLNRIDVAGRPDRTVWKIDSSLQQIDRLQEIVQSIFSLQT